MCRFELRRGDGFADGPHREEDMPIIRAAATMNLGSARGREEFRAA